MPSEQSAPTQPQPEDLDLSREQAKVCIVCRTPVSSADVDYPLHQLLIEQDIPLLCAGCRETRSIPIQQQHPISVGGRSSLTGADFARPPLPNTTVSFPTSQTHSSTSSSPPDVPELSHSVSTSSESSQSQKDTRHETIHSPSPLVDITRLRVRSPTHHCLYPGATFTGTQKSVRSSYDVKVTIVVRVSPTVILVT